MIKQSLFDILVLYMYIKPRVNIHINSLLHTMYVLFLGFNLIIHCYLYAYYDFFLNILGR